MLDTMNSSDDHSPSFSHRWEKETRYYQALVQPDLFGWVVIKRWGGIGKPSGQQRTIPCDSYSAALTELKRIVKTRHQRGYHLVIPKE